MYRIELENILMQNIIKDEDVPRLKELAEQTRLDLVNTGLIMDYCPADVGIGLAFANKKKEHEQRIKDNSGVIKSYKLKSK
jgi:hypothetical protein